MGRSRYWYVIYKEETVEHDTSKLCWNLECEDDTVPTPGFDSDDVWLNDTTTKARNVCPKCIWFSSQHLYGKAFVSDKQPTINIEDKHKVLLRPVKYMGRAFTGSDFSLNGSKPHFWMGGETAYRYSQDSVTHQYHTWSDLSECMGKIRKLDGPWRSDDKDDLESSEITWKWVEDAFIEADKIGREAVVLDYYEQ